VFVETVAGLLQKIRRRAADVLSAALRNPTTEVTVAGSHNPRVGDAFLRVRHGARDPAWGVFLFTYEWYTRVYYNGLAVLGDWFITHAGRRLDGPLVNQKTSQQSAIDLLQQTYGKTPDDLGVCQPAAAVNLTWLRRRCPFSDGHEVDVVAGVIARPFPGYVCFLPHPGTGAADWLPRRGSYAYVYTADMGKKLTPTYDLAAARAEAERYAALRRPALQPERQSTESSEL
jgi:hypothetical protein